MGTAILVLSDDNILTHLHPKIKKTVRELHWIIQIVAAISNIVGFATIIHHKTIKGLSHFQSSHAILGLVTIILSFVAAVGGISTLCAAKLKKWIKPSHIKLLHTILGMLTFVLGIATQVTGLTKSTDDPSFTPITVLLVFAACVVFEGAIRHAYSRLIRLSS
jgi:hypothetical protein